MSSDQLVPIQELTTPGGLTIWFVHSPEIPMISLEAAFRAGQAFLPEDHQGLADLTASLMDEGAGDMDMQACQQALETIGASISGDGDRLNFTLTLTTLSEKQDEAFALLKQAVNVPRRPETE